MHTHIYGYKQVGRAVAAGLLLAAMSLPLHANENFYVGIDLHNWSLDPDGGSGWSDIGIRGKLGAKIAQQVSLEGHLATGGSDRANGTTLELDELYGLFVRGDIPISRYAGLYGLVGYSTLKVSAFGGSDTDSGVSFGVGGDFKVSNDTSLNIDWIRYIGETDYEYSALSLGARWLF
ncbi:MAG: porin family protein [Aquisalimonadaceae bacterium]